MTDIYPGPQEYTSYEARPWGIVNWKLAFFAWNGSPCTQNRTVLRMYSVYMYVWSVQPHVRIIFSDPRYLYLLVARVFGWYWFAKVGKQIRRSSYSWQCDEEAQVWPLSHLYFHTMCREIKKLWWTGPPQKNEHRLNSEPNLHIEIVFFFLNYLANVN